MSLFAKCVLKRLKSFPNVKNSLFLIFNLSRNCFAAHTGRIDNFVKLFIIFEKSIAFS